MDPVAEPPMIEPCTRHFPAFQWAPAIVARLAHYHKTRPNVIPCKTLCSTSFSRTMEC